MNNTTTHYQTSFKVEDTDKAAFLRLKSAVYGWILRKEKDRALRDDKGAFYFRSDWPNLFQTHSAVSTETYRNDAEGDAWAMRYKHTDREHGAKRFWYSDIGLKQSQGVVIVSVRVSHEWNTEYLNQEPEPPSPSVPQVIRYIIEENKLFSGRPEFRLKEKPILFDQVGMGQDLCEFIQSPDRRYPLIVFNGNSSVHVCEAEKLARHLAGKCQVVVIAENAELREEIQHFLPEEYWVQADRMRIYFPFQVRRNSPDRHRYYNVHWPDYLEKREGILHGLLRHPSAMEEGAIESIDDVKRLISREKLLKLKDASSELKKDLEEFYDLYEGVEKERDQLKKDATAFAAEADQHEAEAARLKEEATRLKWERDTFQTRLTEMSDGEATMQISKLVPSLPRDLADVARMAQRCCPRLVITDQAIKTAEDYSECKSLNEAWEMLRHLNDTMYRLKFEQGEMELEKSFRNESNYDFAVTEGPTTKKDKKLMHLRKLQHGGQEYDITPHLKFHREERKLVRIYFAFDEKNKKIIVGHIGDHLDTAATRNL